MYMQKRKSSEIEFIHPLKTFRTQWAQDSFSFGSYSSLGINSSPHHRSMLGTPVDDKLFFAGEATSVKYPGTIHGAFLEGQRVARLVLENCHKKVLIIGAGISGLSAAHFLRRSGVSAVVLEGRDRIGGRIFTSYEQGIPIELGAMWIHGDSSQNPLIELAKSLGLKTFKPKLARDLKYNIYNSSLSLFDSKVIITAIQFYRNFINNFCKNNSQNYFSTQDALNHYINANKIDKSVLKILMFLIYLNFEIPAAIPVCKQSSRFSMEKFSFAGDNVLILEGLSKIVDYLTEGLDIRLNQVVHCIDYSNQEIVIRTNLNDFSSDVVIVTIPLGVLKKRVINFYPELPSNQLNSIDSLEFGKFEKVYLVYNAPLKIDKSIWSVILEEVDLYLLFTNFCKINNSPVILMEGTNSFVEFAHQFQFEEIMNLTNTLINCIT